MINLELQRSKEYFNVSVVNKKNILRLYIFFLKHKTILLPVIRIKWQASRTSYFISSNLGRKSSRFMKSLET